MNRTPRRPRNKYMENSDIRKISLDLLDDPLIAMRSDVQDENIEELMSDMESAGLIQPITVRQVGERYEVIAGHRRTTAARRLGWPVIEAKIVIADDDSAFSMRAMENLSRSDVNPADEAMYVGQLIRKKGKSYQEVAKLFNRSENWIEQRLAIFDMPHYLKEYVGQKRISLGAALHLVRIENERTREYYCHWAALHGVSVSGAKRFLDLWLSEREQMTTDPEIMAAAALGSGQFVAKQTCVACQKEVPLPELVNVWVHEGGECPPDEVRPVNGESPDSVGGGHQESGN